ncbi:MAG TPA: hypothetical protein VF585_07735 [Chthoniobacterales bacterium]
MRNLTSVLLFGVLLTGCEDREIKTYSIAKETPSSSGLPPPASASAKPQWTVPTTWKEIPGTGMRAASFTVENSAVDISVVTFPGTAGGLLSNINRWREQLGLPALTSDAGVETISVHAQPAQIVELISATEDKAILGAIFLREDQSWFIKLTGDKASAAAEKANFEALAKSFDFGIPHTHESTNDG